MTTSAGISHTGCLNTILSWRAERRGRETLITLAALIGGIADERAPRYLTSSRWSMTPTRQSRQTLAQWSDNAHILERWTFCPKQR